MTPEEIARELISDLAYIDPRDEEAGEPRG